ncbi:hypothetical protein M0812_09200 [Anaeramoeba flamelloides]|uniref:Hyaluronan/mRNA-binding protein domain-containing protein n=1 Tax=Anaeramoeba flamelloides TaxID=1746091 RepID=A0AAV7ZMX4_9EUKA|nr:hypothetical protein M0812_09200 [Anaeramoeba flamelloides]
MSNIKKPIQKGIKQPRRETPLKIAKSDLKKQEKELEKQEQREISHKQQKEEKSKQKVAKQRKREKDRKSGSGLQSKEKREGSGKYNWGKQGDYSDEEVENIEEEEIIETQEELNKKVVTLDDLKQKQKKEITNLKKQTIREPNTELTKGLKTLKKKEDLSEFSGKKIEKHKKKSTTKKKKIETINIDDVDEEGEIMEEKRKITIEKTNTPPKLDNVEDFPSLNK